MALRRRREDAMWEARRIRYALGIAIFAAIAMQGSGSFAQNGADPNAAPNPYHVDEGWAKLPQGRKWGAAIGVDIDRDGKSVWVFDRCGTPDDCSGSNLAPIQKFDASGKPGVAGDGPDTFNGPSDVLVAPNGDIFVADGHGGETNARIVKLTKDGKFIKGWGKKGPGPGEFDTPHGLAMDSAGRLFVADRGNSRIQIFDQNGKFLQEWRQFGRPSGIFIDQKDMIYVSDSTSTDKTNPGFKQGIRIGKVQDGKVTTFIPWSEGNTLEAVAADDQGNVYGGFTNTMNFRRFAKN